MSIAHALAVVLILRVASAAARASAPTWSTPGRPCRNRRSDASSRVTSPQIEPRSSGRAHRRPVVDASGRRLGCALVQTVVVDHPIVQARLTVMRDERSSNAEFRAALRELATLLVYEATRDLAIDRMPITTPVGADDGHRDRQPAAAGAGAAGRPGHGRGRVQPAAGVADGLRRAGPRRADPRAARRTWRRCPSRWPAGRCIVLDPMLATGGSLLHCLQLLADRGADDVTVVCALAAPGGAGRARATAACRCGCSPPASTSGSTRTPTSCPGSATPATGSSDRGS